MSALEEQTVAEAMEPLREMLAADGYALRVATTHRSLTVNIDATPDACEDCLAPAGTIELIVKDRLESAGIPTEGVDLEVVMPAGGH
jgi:hypothetical protein